MLIEFFFDETLIFSLHPTCAQLLSFVQPSATPWTAACRLIRPWDFPGKNTGVGCHCLLQGSSWPRALTWISCIGRQILYNWYHLGSQISSCLAGMYHRENCRVEKHKSKHNKVVHRKLKSFHTNWFLLWFTSNCEFFLNSSDLRGLDQLLIPLQCWIPEYTRPTSSKLFWA